MVSLYAFGSRANTVQTQAMKRLINKSFSPMFKLLGKSQVNPFFAFLPFISLKTFRK